MTIEKDQLCCQVHEREMGNEKSTWSCRPMALSLRWKMLRRFHNTGTAGWRVLEYCYVFCQGVVGITAIISLSSPPVLFGLEWNRERKNVTFWAIISLLSTRPFWSETEKRRMLHCELVRLRVVFFSWSVMNQRIGHFFFKKLINDCPCWAWGRQ